MATKKKTPKAYQNLFVALYTEDGHLEADIYFRKDEFNIRNYLDVIELRKPDLKPAKVITVINLAA